MSQAELIDRVIEWVRENHLTGSSVDGNITPDTDLLRSGVLDSLGFIDLLAFIESQTGYSVDLGDAKSVDFSIVKGLCRLTLSNQR